MKLKKLTIHNITSFKDAEIDFECEALNKNLFLICGDTGSGKTTLLDCICLALYNQTPRTKDAKNEKLNATDTLNIGTDIAIKDTRLLLRNGSDQARVELIFEGNDGIVYTSSWAVGRITKGENKGKINKIERVLQFNGTQLVKTKDIDAQIEMAVGLNFDQFCQTSMLAQGDFTKFLKSDVSERSAILEKLTGTDIYTQLGKKIAERTSLKRQALEAEKNKKENIPILNPEEIVSIQNSTLQRQQQVEADTKEVTRLQELLSLTETLQEKQTKFHDTEEQLKQCTRQYRDLLDIYEGLKQEYTKKTNQQKQISDTLQTLELRKITLEHAQTITAKTEEINNKQAAITTSEQQKQICLTKLTPLKEQIARLQDKYSQEWEQLEKANKDIEALQLELKKHDENAIRNELEKNRSTEQLCDQLFDNWKKNIEKENELRIQQDKLNALRQQITQETEQLHTFEEQVRNLQNEYNAKRSLYDKVKVSCEDYLQELRLKLSVGDKCPLCGADVTACLHNEDFQSMLLPLEEEVNQVSSLLNECTEKRNKLEAKIKEEVKRLNEITENINTLTSAFEQQQENIRNTCNTLGLAFDKNTLENNIKERKEGIQRQISQLKIQQDNIVRLHKQIDAAIANMLQIKDIAEETNKEYLKTLQDFQQEQNLIKQYDNTIALSRQEITTHENNIQGLLCSYYLQWWKQDNNTLIQNIQQDSKTYYDYKNTLLTLTNSIENYEKDIRGIEKLQEEMIKLAPKWINEHAANPHFASQTYNTWNNFYVHLSRLRTLYDSTKTDIEQMEKKIEQYQTDLEKQHPTDIASQITFLKLQKETLHKQIEAYNQEIGKNKLRLEQNTLNEQSIKDIQNSITLMEEEYNKWKQLCDIFGDGSGNRFRNIAQSFVLKHLLNNANAQLQQLSPRFSLQCVPGNLTILIFDRYTGATKSTTNLSGGESFLISLSLALALSSLQQGNASVDTLFIDEGFGSLDSDYLETVTATLNNLHENIGKRVGIISHIKEMEEKIPTKIIVSRIDNTTSKINIV